jgi:UDP-glucose 4-epimerase
MYSGVISLFITALIENRQPRIYGDGTQSRDFTYVANVVEGNMLAMHSPNAPGKIMNVATGTRETLLELLDSLGAIVGNRPEPIFDEPRAGDVKHSLASIRWAKDLLDYEPTVDFDEGLARTVAWYRENAGA